MPSPGKPWITANQVTLARLIPMPLLSWLLYKGADEGFAGNPYMWSALIAGTLIGCTDWVDGMLARKYGPTVLGGLLDPIADKVFIAFAYVPFADDKVALIPAWACALMFVREFFITALRSAYEQRGLALKTSYLAKVKTWTQMQGIGVVLLFPLVQNPDNLTWLLGTLTVLPLLVMAYFAVVKKKFWRGALVMSGSVAPILALHLHGDVELSLNWIMLAVVAITWISGLDYIIVGWPQLRARGDFNRADAVRLIGAITMPCLLFGVLVETPAPAWPVFAILAFELACGGLDNLMSHHKKATKSLAWGSRVLGISALLGAALLLPDYSAHFSIAAVIVSVVGVAAEFWRGRDYFLDKRIRDKALREAAAVDPRDHHLQ
ncbi:MAG: CDP-alcohol phosphatidyltransferase family protein [Deltaproteobacteria bacterium]|nr:CDP-alcohol phosphatidyltransferase family protein [Deltaproteobacteria bacterium]MDQ3296039.1 CDP-alcohol phosphatidyltransferase family protein [Myxococcota bacterium]